MSDDNGDSPEVESDEEVTGAGSDDDTAVAAAARSIMAAVNKMPPPRQETMLTVRFRHVAIAVLVVLSALVGGWYDLHTKATETKVAIEVMKPDVADLTELHKVGHKHVSELSRLEDQSDASETESDDDSNSGLAVTQR